RPGSRPARPFFSSGPCAKIPGFQLQTLEGAVLGRSHRSAAGKARLKQALALTREVLDLPAEYRIAVVPASDTGAVEMALWTMLGRRGVDVLAWESFGRSWASDVKNQLKLKDVRIIEAPYGELPDLSLVDARRDCVFTWNGTTSGVRVPDANWISDGREGLTICDATSAVFAQAVDFPKLDVVTFSGQKALGGEAAHGMIVLSPRAIERLENYSPPWPTPKIFRLASGGRMNEALFEGETINTPSMLCVEDWIVTLTWAKSIGGLKTLMQRADANAAVLSSWLKDRPWIAHLARDPRTRSNTSVCLTVQGDESVPKRMAKLLEEEQAAFDIAAHRDSPPGLRIWCGPTVEAADIKALLPWLDWAHGAAAAVPAGVSAR
ncbi:MAG TPA: phosphoserine transaminase, partial [Aestuariivirgaceae bacterium]